MTKTKNEIIEQDREIPQELFDLRKLTSANMSPNKQKAYIDKHWIILNDGNHALLSEGVIKIYDSSIAKATYFSRMSKELQDYYFKERKDIRKIICNPNKPRISSTHLNLCKKMMAKRIPFKDCSEKAKKAVEKLNAYVLKVLCKGNKDIFNHLIKMCAKMVRCEKNDACIYLKGAQGCGKSTFPEFLRTFVMGNDLAIETGSAPLKNKFNKELEAKIMVMLEELDNFGASEWIGISSVLKRWITSPTITIEAKGENVVMVENLITFWLLSNNDAIQDDDGRRYFILPVSTEHMNDKIYFGDIRDTCFNQEVGDAYYNYLMDIDLTDFYSQNYPITQSKLDSVAKRLDNVYKFLKFKYILHKRGIDKVSVSNLHEQYVQYCTQHQFKFKNKVDFNRTLEDIGIVRIKSNSSIFYRITYDNLKAIADKFHWVHELDEVCKNDDDNAEFEPSMFINKDDKAEYIRAEEFIKEKNNLNATIENIIELKETLQDEFNNAIEYIKQLEKLVNNNLQQSFSKVPNKICEKEIIKEKKPTQNKYHFDINNYTKEQINKMPLKEYDHLQSTLLYEDWLKIVDLANDNYDPTFDYSSIPQEKPKCTCGWNSSMQESHIEHSKLNGCAYIKSSYDLSYDSDGEIVAKKKVDVLSSLINKKEEHFDFTEIGDGVFIHSKTGEVFNQADDNDLEDDSESLF